MPGTRIKLLAGLVAGFLFGVCAPAVSAEGTGGQVLMLSDVHFDPMAEPDLVDRLGAAEPENWRGILESSGKTALSPYGRDTNWMLLRSVLLQMKQTLPDAQFLVLAGDFLAHNLRGSFDAIAKEHSDATYRVFVGKTMQFLALQLEETFPDRPILPALGNNDDVCGDFLLQAGGPFLADMLPILRSLIGGGLNSAFDRGWAEFGNYSVKVRGIRVVAVNTVFFSRRYRNACGSPDDRDPGRATLAWLEAELGAAAEAQERVWLLYHVPPGIDGFATLLRGSCPDDLLLMWEPAYAEAFYALLRRYADSVAVSVAGHTHMDDFRLIGDKGGHYGFALITPAVSPIFGQNPAFRTASYDPGGGIVDETTFYLTNLADGAAGGNVPPVWQPEYTFSREWNLPRVDLPSLERLYSLIQDEPTVRARWHEIFPVSSQFYWSQLSSTRNHAQAVRAFRCATGNVLPAEYSQCYCGNHG